MEKYNQYKNSEVEWLREIPSHWEVKKFKYLTTYMQSGTNLTAIQIKDQGKYPVYGGNGRRGFYDEANWMKSCIIIGRQGALCGNVHIVKEPIWATDHAVITMNNKTTNIDYLFYLALIMNFNQYASQTAAQPGIAVGTIKNVSTCLPPLSEQHTIVTYLDTKVKKINKHITTAEKKIAALDELKQVTIADAVTHGIHPNVPMKNSGIRWIGQMPKHWNMKRTAIMFTENKTKNSKYEFQRAMKFNYGNLIAKNEQGDISEFRETYEAYTIINKDDIAINCLNLNYDFVSQRIAISPQKGILTSAYLIISARHEVNPHFFTYLFKAMDNMKLFHGMGTGIRLTLSYNELKKQELPVPPLSEQEEIVSYIDRKVAQIDKMRNAELAQIERLKEYKQRLISDVVTGKVKV